MTHSSFSRRLATRDVSRRGAATLWCLSGILLAVSMGWMFLPTDGTQGTESVHLKQVPFVLKKPDFGGEACGESVLRFLGLEVDQDAVFDRAGVDPILGRGCVTRELVTSLQRFGLQTGSVWYSANDRDRLWRQILADLNQRRPTIVVVHIDNAERFVLIVGYHDDSDSVIYHDPNRRDGIGLRVDRTRFLKSMVLDTAGEAPQVVAIRTNGNPRQPKVDPARFTDADYAQHVRELKQRLPNDEFSIVIEKPFVVVGDGGVNAVKRTASGTVKWAVDQIKKDYFKKDPRYILDVWLFKNPTSYNKHNVELFGKKPGTPYGFYSSHHRALVMDISTGGGTLVHEIVHPFIESNFVDCPSWFNEGLASLYEQSSSREGHIVGLTNWRLRGLQRFIEAKRLPSFESLCKTTTREFYNDAGTNYAQARYLCYYLQERGLLVKYYHAFVQNAAKDPSGFKTLKSVLGVNDMVAFQAKWEKFVMELKYP